MYKDVWKKFGTKILIVLCSILLLGGVAIAAPKLQAETFTEVTEEKRISLKDVAIQDVDHPNEPTPITPSGAAISIVNSTFSYSDGALVYPKTLEITFKNSPDKYLLKEGTDYTVQPVNCELTQAGKKTIDIVPSLQSKLLTGRDTCRLSYNVDKLKLPAVTYKINNDVPNDKPEYADYDYLLVSDVNAPIQTSKIQITINGTQLTSGYEFVDENGQPYTPDGVGLSKKTLYIKYTNYYNGSSDTGDKSSWANPGISIKKDIASVTVTIDGMDSGTYLADPYTPPSNVVASDGSSLTASDYTWSTDLKTINGVEVREVRVTAQGDNYGGYWVQNYPVTRTNLTLEPVDAKFQTAQDYDEIRKTYEFTPNEIRISGTNMTVIPGSTCEVKEWQIVTNESSRIPIKGATAGLVEAKVEITEGTYKGQSGYIYYLVQRSIEMATFENKAVDGDDYTYARNVKHTRNALVYFKDSPGFNDSQKDDYCIRPNADYEVTYKLNKWNAGNYEDNNITDAGTVYMTITGNLGATKPAAGSRDGGYYGSVTDSIDHPGLSYEIAKRPLDNSYYIELTPTVYELGCTERDVINGAIIRSKDNDSIRWPITELNDRYTTTTTFEDGTTLENWADKEPGDYNIAFEFSGNFTGILDADFEVEEYDTNGFEITLGKCPEDGENASEHIYTKGEHRPAVIEVRYTKNGQDVLINSSQYRNGIKYIDNVEAGEATVEITLTSGTVIKKKFTILPQELDGNSLRLTSNDGFTGQPDAKKHDYSGPVQLPDIKNLTLEIAGRKNLALVEGTDFNVVGLYDEQDNPVNASEIKLNTKYRFKIKAAGENFITAEDPNIDGVYTEFFTFNARHIYEEEIKCSINPRTPYNPNHTASDYQTYIENNLKVVDQKFGNEPLIVGTDYKIEVTDIDSIKSNGTVKYKVVTTDCTGCYDESREETLYVGQDIADAFIKEKTRPEFRITKTGTGVGNAALNDSYAPTSSGSYNVEFVTGTSHNSNKISLRYYNANGGQITLSCGDKTGDDGQYYVEIEEGSVSGTQTGQLTITGRNGYYGKVTVSFKIEQIDISKQETLYKVVFLEDETNNVYTGTGIEPLLKVESVSTANFKQELVEGTDYTISWDRNISANTDKDNKPYAENNQKAVAIINGINGYTGTIYGYFTIYKRPISRPVNYTNPDGEVVTYQAIDDRYFNIGNWQPEQTYTYTPYTNVDGNDQVGVRPQLDLYFNAAGTSQKLTKGPNNDFVCTYENNINACDVNVSHADRPKVIFKAADNSNFTGEFEAPFSIRPVTLTNKDQCTISLQFKRQAFSGNEIKPIVTVTLIRDDGTTYTLEQDRLNKDYRVDYENYRFVSVGGLTRVIVNGITEGNRVTGNCVGTYTDTFVIYGEFQPKSTAAAENSEMIISGGSIDYSPTSIKGACSVVYRQKAQGQPNYDSTDNELVRIYELTEGVEYEVTAPNIVGIQDAQIRSTCEYFEGSASCKITIRGDLGADYTVVNGPGTVSYSSGQTFALQDKITVTCGGRTLVYGKDYKFDRVPTMNLGTDNEVRIIPCDDVPYLTGSRLITYEVKSGLDSIQLTNVISAEDGAYTYAHGEDVIKEENINVTMDGNTLQNNVDYKISIDDKVTVGTHTITIEGIGKYTGTFTQKFRIKPYDLGEGLAKEEIRVNYEATTTYTGGTALPTIKSITAVAPSGNLVTLLPGDDETRGDYELSAGGQGDHINWTSGDVKPNFIISGKGNYEGEITLEYSITRKDISEPEVTETLIEDISYQNGKDITPVPELKYAGRDLAGILYSGNADDYVNWSDFTKHFTYQYSTTTDLKSVGTKTIRVRGIGNFTGERTVTYTVIPLDISLAEVEFVYDTPVYDGQPQQPAFNLWYAGDKILEYTGTQAISQFIKEPKVEFIGNHTDVTKTALIRISAGENDNYMNTKDVTFAILPASLANHTKFMYHPENTNGNVDLSTYKLNYPFNRGNSVMPNYAGEADAAELKETQVGIYYDDINKANHGAFLKGNVDYEVSYQYVEPDSDDVEVREEYRNPNPPLSYAGKVKVTITGIGNYTDSASFWYFIGKDISADASFTISPTTAIYNSQKQYPTLTVTGVQSGEYKIGRYKDEVALKNLIQEKDFVNAGTYYLRIEGDPTNGTYATEPKTLTYTITPRAFSNNLIIDGFKREYSYTGYDICPVGISVTDYIDNIKYKLTEDVDYTLTYTNNLNAGTAYINVEGKNNFSGKATANFMITSSTISSGGSWGTNSFLDQGTGEISGSTAVSPSNVSLTMDTVDAMYYTGRAVYPKVSIAGMTENIDYTVTFSNNVEVGTAVASIKGIGNNNGTITKNFRIIAQLSKCTISPIPAQQYTGSEVKPALTVKCGNNILMEGTDYTATYSNNVNIGTATVTLRAANNSNYTGSTTTTFSIGNDVGGFIISGYAPSYAYTGKAITPGVVVETGSSTLTMGTDYTVSYSNNVNAGTATITVTGIGRYSGTQTASFVIEPKSMQSLDVTEVADRTYTGDAYTPDVTVSDGGTVLTKGVDYTVTYTNNTNPGTASILIESTNSNYAGTKIISFKISAVAVKGLKASTVKYNSIKLKWTKQDYATGYQVCDSNSKVVKTVKTNSATITGLSAGKTYKYKVRSYINNADGTRSYGAFSSVLSTTTKLKTPTVKVVSNAKGQARISWSKVSGATGYEIYYKKSASAKYKKLKTVNNPNVRICTVRGLKSGDRAYFRVRAFKKSGSKKIYSALNPLKVITVK